jgi:prepilin-type N-terminal cleavage/methylation domain-containing protein
MSRIGRTPDDYGFTLLELLVAMALLSIASVLVLAWLPSMADRLAVDRSARQIDRVLSRAASEAKSTGLDQIVIFELSGRAPTLICGNRTVELDPSIEMKWLAASEAGSDSERSAVVFLATGGASGGSVALRRGEAWTSVKVDWLTGATRQEAVSDDRP